MRYIYFFLLLIIFSCNREEKKYEKYFNLDKVPSSSTLLSTNKKPLVPFPNNNIYDPFITNINAITLNKNCFETGKVGKLKLTVLFGNETSIDVSKRKSESIYVKGWGVIIENVSLKDTTSLTLNRGKPILIQEVFKSKKWIEIERIKINKMGVHFYNIFPGEYVYTKIPIYKGVVKVKMRAKLLLADKTFYSNEYEGKVPKWVLK